MSRVRNWVFTLNNPDKRPEFTEPMRYLVFQAEQGSENQTPHYQGYVEFTKAMRMNTVKGFFSDRVHLEPRRGSRQQARDYAMKEDTRVGGPWEYGKFVADGERTDLQLMFDKVKEGKSNKDIIEEYPAQYVRSVHAVEKYRFALDKELSRDFRQVKVYVFHGKTGTGKSSAARVADPNWYSIDQEYGGWFDGYYRESTLIIEDFGGWIPFRRLLTLLDGYQCRLPVKHGHTYAMWTRVVITANHPPDYWYPHARPDLAPLYRRITEIKEFI